MGAVLGFLSGLGLGGGSLLMLWLTLGAGMDPGTARSINLLFFLPTALISSLFRWKQGCLPIKQLWPAMVCGCISAALFSRMGTGMAQPVLRRLLGALLLLTGIRELTAKK